MADVVLSAELQARVDQFVANLLTASNSADNTGRSVSDMSAGISRNIANVNRTNLSAFTNAMNNGALSVQRLGAAVPAITSSLTRANPSIQRSGQTLTDFGRIVQDAPFGFIAIQNNLNPLIESFGRLRSETGSNALAFKALFSSLAGPAGIGIAISLVTSAITYYTIYQQKANKANVDAKKTTEDYISTLDQLTQVQVKGAQTAQKEVTDLRILYGVYQNTNASLKDRKEAYSQLQEQYPEYFKNIKFENNASEQTKKAYEELTTAIIATGRARAAADLITKNSSRQLENEQKVADLEKQKLKDQLAYNNAVKRGTVSGGAGIVGVAGSSGIAIAENQKLVETQSQINNLKTDTNILTQRNIELVKSVNAEVEKGAKLPGEGFGDKPIKINPKISVGNKNVLPALPLDEFYVALSSGITEINPKLKINPVIIGLSDLEKMSKKASDAIDDILYLPNLVDVAGKGIGSAFESMGAAIASGGNILDAAGAAIQASFQELLSALGDQFITMGAAKVAAGILATPFGGALVSQGAGLIALGAGLKLGGGLVGGIGKGNNKTSKGPTAFANGGIISGPTLGLMGEYAGAKSNPEVVAPLSKLKSMLGETDDMGNVIGKRNAPIILNSEYTIKGQDILIVTKIAQKESDRIG